MPTTFKSAVTNYLKATPLSRGTQAEYRTTVRKWTDWGGGVSIERLGRKEIREFLDWVYEHAVAEQGTNPGRAANKAREQLRAVLSCARVQELIEAPPRFPEARQQRDIAGRHYLTKAEINALYFATYRMPGPRGWDSPFPLGQYWRCALVLFFNYGLDTGTVWGSTPEHEPILWRHVSWSQQSPDCQTKERSRWGWLYYRRVKTGKAFHRPLNRVVHAHLKSIAPSIAEGEEVVLLRGSSRPNSRFQELCTLAGIQPKKDPEMGKSEAWELKDLRKTCATYYDAHMPESAIEILVHSVGGLTYRHYAHRAPLAYRAIMTLPQPSAFMALLQGHDGRCPCCRRPFFRD